MEVEKFYDISNLEHKSLIITDSRLNPNSIKSSLVIPVKEEYSIDQLIYAICRRVKKVEMIFYSKTRKELTFYSTVPMGHIAVSSLMAEEQKNKAEAYRKEAEKFKKKLEEICEAEKKGLEQQISLKDYLNLLMKSYERETKYIQKIENRWHNILVRNYATMDNGYQKIAFEKFEDGILSFKVYQKRYGEYITFFVPKDIEKTWVRQFNLVNEKFYDIHDNEEALKIFSFLIHEIQSLYEHCSQRTKLYALFSREEFSSISYQEYEIKMIVKEEDKKINKLTLLFLHDSLKIAEIIFYYLGKEDKEDVFFRIKKQISTLGQNASPYHHYALNVPNIMLNSYLKQHMSKILKKIILDKENCNIF